MSRRISTLHLLTKVGELIHGEYWQAAMARELQVNRRTITRWLQQESPVPDVVLGDNPFAAVMTEMVARHERDLAQTKELLRKYIEQEG